MKKLTRYVVPVALMGAVMSTALVASAHGFGGGMGFMRTKLSPAEMTTVHEERFAKEAALLGVSVDVVKNGWAAGKTLSQIATDSGMTKEQLQAKMKQEATTQMKAHLDVMVAAGVITQAQADARLAFMTQKQQNEKVKRGGMRDLRF